MSTYFLRGSVYYVGVPTRVGGWVKRSTGTGNKALASAMARMMDELGPRGRRQWLLLDPVREGRLSVPRLYDAFSEGTDALAALESELKDLDLEPFVPKWLASIADNVAPDTRQHYETHVRTLIEAGRRFPASALRRAKLVEWLSSRECGPSTKRKYHAAMSSFCQYLVSLDLIPANPMRDVRPPAASKPRTSYLEQADVLRLLDAQPEPYRTLSALMHGTGIEVSTALRLRRRDIDLETGAIHAHGTKTQHRDRMTYLDAWAKPYVTRHIAMLTPNALVFPDLNRWTVSDKHREACALLGIENYTLRDSRHTFAVRAIRAGASAEVVARQLGHGDTQMVNRVYGRFRPTQDEMTAWQQRAAERDRTMGAG